MIKISKNANSTLGFLKKNLKHCPKNSRRTAYLSLVRSTLEYSSIVWDPYPKRTLINLKRHNVMLPDLSQETTFQGIRGVSKMLEELDDSFALCEL